MDLYHHPMLAGSRAIQMTAKALDLKLNLKHIDVLKGEQLTPEFLKMNPQHSIPTLVDNGFVLWESRAIVIYLVEKYAKDDSLYPIDSKTRAIINQRLFFDLGTLSQKFVKYFTTKYIYKLPDDPELWKAMVTAVGIFNAFLEGQEFVACNHVTIADICLFATISFYKELKVDFQEFPNVRKWMEKCEKTLPGIEINEEGIELFRKALQDHDNKGK